MKTLNRIENPALRTAAGLALLVLTVLAVAGASYGLGWVTLVWLLHWCQPTLRIAIIGFVELIVFVFLSFAANEIGKDIGEGWEKHRILAFSAGWVILIAIIAAWSAAVLGTCWGLGWLVVTILSLPVTDYVGVGFLAIVGVLAITVVGFISHRLGRWLLNRLADLVGPYNLVGWLVSIGETLAGAIVLAAIGLGLLALVLWLL